MRDGVVEVETAVFQIDHCFQGSRGVIASYLLAGDGPPALIEAGPASTMEALLAGIRAAGEGSQAGLGHRRHLAP